MMLIARFYLIPVIKTNGGHINYPFVAAIVGVDLSGLKKSYSCVIPLRSSKLLKNTFTTASKRFLFSVSILRSPAKVHYSGESTLMSGLFLEP